MINVAVKLHFTNDLRVSLRLAFININQRDSCKKQHLTFWTVNEFDKSLFYCTNYFVIVWLPVFNCSSIFSKPSMFLVRIKL